MPRVAFLVLLIFTCLHFFSDHDIAFMSYNHLLSKPLRGFILDHSNKEGSRSLSGTAIHVLFFIAPPSVPIAFDGSL